MLTITQKDHKKEIAVRHGDTVEIILFENPGTGYQWTLTPAKGMSIVENRYEPATKAVGSGGHRHLLIRLDGPGRLELAGHYRRPWEKEVTGTEFAVTFAVSG